MKPQPQPPTHLAVSLPVAKRVRQILGAMAHDEVRDLLLEFDSSPTVNINAPASAPAPVPVSPEEVTDEQSDQRH